MHDPTEIPAPQRLRRRRSVPPHPGGPLGLRPPPCKRCGRPYSTVRPICGDCWLRLANRPAVRLETK